jgi:anti-sigma B factor antagonist
MAEGRRTDRLLITTARVSHGAIVVRLEGELDASTVGEFERAVDELPTPLDLLVLDLRALSFVDSLGLNQLFRLHQRAAHAGFELRLVRPPLHVHRLIALSAMDRALGPFYPDPEAALRA